MTIKDLIELIEERRKILSVPIPIDPGYEMCKAFADSNSIVKFDDFANIDIWEFLKCKAYVSIDNASINDSEEIVEVFKNAFQSLDLDLVDSIKKLFLGFKADGQIPIIIDYLKEKNIIKEKLILRSIYPNEPEVKKVISEFKHVIISKYTNRDFIRLLEIIDEHDIEPIQVLLELYSAYLMVNFTLKENEKAVASLGFNVRKRDIKKVLENTFKNNFNVSTILSEVREVQNFVYKCENEERRARKDVAIELEGLEKALVLLERAMEQDEITNAKKIVNHIKDLNIKLAFLEFIYNYNKKKQQIQTEELNVLNQNTEVNYVALLNDYNISCDIETVNRIMHNNLEDVKIMLNILRRMNMEEENIIKILSNSSLEVVAIIKEYLDKGYLTLDIINSNIDLFYLQADKLQILNDNINILQQYNINPAIFKDSFFILTMDSSTSNLEKNLELLDNYNLLRFIRNSNDYSFLRDNDLATKIDRILELGYEEFLESNLGLLNSNNIKRLEVLKAMGMPVTSLLELEEVLSDNNPFFIKDEDLDSYIPNIVPYKQLLELNDDFSLDSYRKTTRTYSFNGVLISIPKVERLIKMGKTKGEALFFNSNLSEEEYEQAMEVINQYASSK